MTRSLVAFLIFMTFMVALSFFGWMSGRWDEEQPAFGLASAESRIELCMDDDSRERVRGLMFTALDEALKDKIHGLMEIWLRDPTGQPERAARGVDAALRAYSQARIAALKFNPPACAG